MEVKMTKETIICAPYVLTCLLTSYIGLLCTAAHIMYLVIGIHMTLHLC